MYKLSKVTQKGQILIPKELRDKYGIKTMSTVLLKEINGRIIIESTKNLKKSMRGAFPPKFKTSKKIEQKSVQEYIDKHASR